MTGHGSSLTPGASWRPAMLADRHRENMFSLDRHTAVRASRALRLNVYCFSSGRWWCADCLEVVGPDCVLCHSLLDTAEARDALNARLSAARDLVEEARQGLEEARLGLEAAKVAETSVKDMFGKLQVRGLVYMYSVVGRQKHRKTASRSLRLPCGLW